MFDFCAIDLHNYRLNASKNQGLVWKPKPVVLFFRILLGIFLAFLAYVLLHASGDLPWQRKLAEIKEQARQSEIAERQAEMQEALADLQSLFPDRQNLPVAAEPKTDENPKSANQGQLARRISYVSESLRLVGRMLAAALMLAAVWLPLSFLWDRVRLWRDNQGKIYLRYWLIWPRTHTFPATVNSRLLMWAMEEHHFLRWYRHSHTDWRWVVKPAGGILTVPVGEVALRFGRTKRFPSLIILKQDDAPKPSDRLPRKVQKFKDAAFRLLGLPVDEPQMVYSEVKPRGFFFRGHVDVSRHSQEFPLEVRTVSTREITDPAELQELIRMMSQDGEVVKNPDGSVTITSSRVVKKKSIQGDELRNALKDFLDKLPPETRRTES